MGEAKRRSELGLGARTRVEISPKRARFLHLLGFISGRSKRYCTMMADIRGL